MTLTAHFMPNFFVHVEGKGLAKPTTAPIVPASRAPEPPMAGGLFVELFGCVEFVPGHQVMRVSGWTTDKV